MQLTPWNYALNLLARREHSHHEVKQKLLQKFSDLDLNQVEDVLERLHQAGLLCDQRFADIWVRSRYTQGKGELRIRMELRQKGVDENKQQLAMSQDNLDWFELARQVRSRKSVDLPIDAKDKAKLYRFLANRGFTSDQIQYALSE